VNKSGPADLEVQGIYENLKGKHHPSRRTGVPRYSVPTFQAWAAIGFHSLYYFLRKGPYQLTICIGCIDPA